MCWDSHLMVGLKPGHSCDPIACLSDVNHLTVATINHAATLQSFAHELCHCSDDVTQHCHKSYSNTEGRLRPLTMTSVTALMTSHNTTMHHVATLKVKPKPKS